MTAAKTLILSSSLLAACASPANSSDHAHSQTRNQDQQEHGPAEASSQSTTQLPAQGPGLTVGETLPPLNLLDTQGQPAKLATLRADSPLLALVVIRSADW